MSKEFEVLKKARVIVVVGASRSPDKDAGKVPRYLMRQGYKVIPVNPFASEIEGVKAYPSLLDIPEDIARNIDVVDVFRPPEEAQRIVDQVLELRRRYGRPWAIWFQKGTANPEAVRRAESEGLVVVADKCMMEEHQRMRWLEERRRRAEEMRRSGS